MPYRTVSLTPAMRRRSAPAPLFSNGRLDKAELMRRAVQLARSLRAGGASWSWRMGVALRTVWGWAKREAAAPQGPIMTRVPYQPDPAPRERLSSGRGPQVFIRGSRRFSHGW